MAGKPKAICCGVEVSTPFCPHCGKNRMASPLYTLLAHISAHANQMRQELEYNKQHDDRVKRNLNDKVVCKWEGWRDAVADAIRRLDMTEV